MWVASQDLPRNAAHPFYTRLNQVLGKHDLDEFVEGLCQDAEDIGRPSLPPGRYFPTAADWLLRFVVIVRPGLFDLEPF
jgi:hypothetical protein